MYHLLEFYIHHDSPLSVRVPARPRAAKGRLLTERENQEAEAWNGYFVYAFATYSSTREAEGNIVFCYHWET